MKKFGFIFAAAVLFMSASAFAQTTPSKKEVKKETAATQEKAPHKAHSKHHHHTAKPAPAAPKAK